MNLCEILSDAILFWILQAGLVLFALFAAFQNWRTFGRGNLTMQILRGDATMKIFYGTYAGISGLLVAICLSVDAAKDHRVLWVVVDTLAIFYVCLLNRWSRNHLVGFANYLANLERRSA